MRWRGWRLTALRVVIAHDCLCGARCGNLSVAVVWRVLSMSAVLRPDRCSVLFLRQMWGTAEYFAPEVINQAYGPQADVWALGCVLYEMLCGEQAFPTREGDKKNVFYARICEGKYDLHK